MFNREKVSSHPAFRSCGCGPKEVLWAIVIVSAQLPTIGIRAIDIPVQSLSLLDIISCEIPEH